MQTNPESVSKAFSLQSSVFDELDSSNKLSGHLRKIVRAEMDSLLAPSSKILELNCGTGLDAMYFARQGHSVLATDNAPGMLEEASKKIAQAGLQSRLKALRLSYHNLRELKPQKFDHIFSNFGGLNCTADLKDVLSQLPELLNEGGKITLVIMPRVCPWELVMALKGKFRTAFRRFKRGGTPAQVEGERFLCFYYNPGYVINTLKKDFELLTLKGIYITVPPEFYAGFVDRYPKTYRRLSRIDHFLQSRFPFNRCCDHYMITMQLKPGRIVEYPQNPRA